MKCEYLYDQDPRYGWASIELDGRSTATIVIHGEEGSRGFEYTEKTGEFTPVCICHAYHEYECCCEGVSWYSIEE